MRDQFASICLFFLLTLPACGQQSFDEKLESIYRHTVPVIHPQQLQQWKEEQSDLVLLDIRSIREFQVSRIPGARLVDYKTFDPGKVSEIPRSSRVVVYCSVGYRSERIGEKLQAMGFTEVYNLYGGIFNWKNQGQAVVDSSGEPTDSVHTYNKNWGQWLERGIKVYE